MSRVDFYHLQKQTLEEVLPKLLQKAYGTGKRILLKTVSEDRVDYINSFLWTYNDESFLPHGSRKDGFADQQPIWLTAGSENSNQADFLFLVDDASATIEEIAKFERVFNIFNGNSDVSLQNARNLWQTYKDADCEIYYWQQSEQGVWEQKK